MGSENRNTRHKMKKKIKGRRIRIKWKSDKKGDKIEDNSNISTTSNVKWSDMKMRKSMEKLQ